VWFVRTAVAPYTLSASVSSALDHASGGLPATRIRSMEDVVSESTARTRFNTSLMMAFALAALLLATIGVYAVIAYTVRQRTHEVGIRLALGASAAAVRQMIIGQGMTLATAGVVVGVIGALAFGRLLAGFLFGVTPRDPLVFAAAASVLAIAAFVATFIPARRASRVDPIVALRSE
jgi:ABC-type antimicrobial peptide transport system permease subunit